MYAFLGNSTQDKVDALGLIGIFGLLGGALIHYGITGVPAGYDSSPSNIPGWGTDWGSVTTSFSFRGCRNTWYCSTYKFYLSMLGSLLRMRKRIKNSQKSHM